MWFLIRGAFWFSLVLVMLPIFNQEATTRLQNEKGVEMVDALGAAAGAISYVGDICSQKPDVCVKGAATISSLGSRAREGARVAYSYLDAKFTNKAAEAKADQVLTGSVVAANTSRIPIPLPRPSH